MGMAGAAPCSSAQFAWLLDGNIPPGKNKFTFLQGRTFLCAGIQMWEHEIFCLGFSLHD